MIFRLWRCFLRAIGRMPAAVVDEETTEALSVLTRRVDQIAMRADRHESEIERQRERLLKVERNIEALKAQTGVYAVSRRHRQGAEGFEQRQFG